MTTTPTPRDQLSSRTLLDFLKRSVPFAQGILVTSVPRGDLQIAQPTSVPEALLNAYGTGLNTQDLATWKAIREDRPFRAAEAWPGGGFESSAYAQHVMMPAGYKFAAVVPLASPVLEGYPGAVHLLRTADQGDFSRADLEKLADLAKRYDEAMAQSRAGRKAHRIAALERPSVHVMIVDGDGNFLFPRDLESVDAGLRSQMAEHARRYAQGINGTPTTGDRTQLPDSHGDHWPFKIVTYKSYPALGQGPVVFFAMQPESFEWAAIKPADFAADPELSRLIPAIKFMQQEYRRGPALEEISGTVNLSPFHFHRRFTELLGLTPKQYMLACQIHEAKAELVSGQKELAQIAKDCGFAHQSHFTSRFKQTTGLTPTRWRRMALQRSKEA